VNAALQNYEVAAGSASTIGQSSTASYLRLDLPRNPAKYLQAGPQIDAQGNLYAVVQNPTAVAVSNVRVRVIRVDALSGQPVAQSQPLVIAGNIAAQQQGNVPVKGVRLNSQQELALYRVQIESAQVSR
jgi:hypothetical protein